MSGTDLDGATQAPAEGERPSTPGAFAALWNGMNEAARQDMVSALMRRSDEATRCFMQDHDGAMQEAAVLRRWVSDVRALHQPTGRQESFVLWCDQDGQPYPCPTARAVGIPATDTEPLDAAKRIRAAVDALHPRTDDDGRINASHVAAESTLREREGLPSWIAELDGPWRFR